MSNILLIEPSYRSKFPPLGLMRLATYHKSMHDAVTFARGKVSLLRDAAWHRIYISSLFTYELPRTVATIQYYLRSVADPSHVIVGGIGATLMPQYIRERVPDCTVIEGPLDKPDMLATGIPAIAKFTPDYSILESVDWDYKPADSYFCRVTTGCTRKCPFCAVPKLEPRFGYYQSLREQVESIIGQDSEERQHLVLLDNNILALDTFENVISDIKDLGFVKGAIRAGRQRIVDFNQGIDARLIDRETAELLGTIALSPARLAFDMDGVEKAYKKAVRLLSKVGLTEFTNYVMFNYTDTPLSFYHRLKLNTELSLKHGVRVTGFPMRYVPITDADRHHVSRHWTWRYLRGVQCVLSATHGMVSPSPAFFKAAFGESYKDFLDILSMPDRYIIHRKKHKDSEAVEWRRLYHRLSVADRLELHAVLAMLNRSKDRRTDMARHRRFKKILEHYYPNGKVVSD